MIVYSCSDLIFATKIRSTAEALGITSRPVNDADGLERLLTESGEAVTALLVDLDAGEAGLALIETAKRHAPEVRVLAFGPHVQKDLLNAARERGADEALPRSAFSSKLPQILKRCAERA